MSLAGRRYQTAGFTLIELIVVLTIIALVAVFAIPRVLPQQSNTALKATAMLLASELRKAHSEAIRVNQSQSMEFNLASRRFGLKGKANVTEFPRDTEIQLVTANTLITGKTGTIRFHSDGSSTGGRVTLSRNGLSYQVDVEWLTGNVTVSK